MNKIPHNSREHILLIRDGLKFENNKDTDDTLIIRNYYSCFISTYIILQT